MKIHSVALGAMAALVCVAFATHWSHKPAEQAIRSEPVARVALGSGQYEIPRSYLAAPFEQNVFSSEYVKVRDVFIMGASPLIEPRNEHGRSPASKAACCTTLLLEKYQGADAKLINAKLLALRISPGDVRSRSKSAHWIQYEVVHPNSSPIRHKRETIFELVNGEGFIACGKGAGPVEVCTSYGTISDLNFHVRYPRSQLDLDAAVRARVVELVGSWKRPSTSASAI